jgi:hypothetical protein
MAKRTKFQEMRSSVRQSLAAVPEHRKGRNIQYQITQAGLEARLVALSPQATLMRSVGRVGGSDALSVRAQQGEFGARVTMLLVSGVWPQSVGIRRGYGAR